MLAPYPALVTASINVSMEALSVCETRALSVARLTLALTPGTRFSTFSTRVAQAAQVMPLIARSVTRCGCPGEEGVDGIDGVDDEASAVMTPLYGAPLS